VSTFEVLVMVALVLIACASAYAAGMLRERDRERKDEKLRRAVSKLPGWQPQLMVLHCCERYNYLEIAGLLHLPKDHVLEEMSKAYAALRMQHMPVEADTRRRGRIRIFLVRMLVGRLSA
jgi:DNA-directed RNA polymerase specialized sigma24 family protein